MSRVAEALTMMMEADDEENRLEQRVGWMEASWKEFRKVGSEQVSVVHFTGEISRAKDAWERAALRIRLRLFEPPRTHASLRLFLRHGRAPCLLLLMYCICTVTAVPMLHACLSVTHTRASTYMQSNGLLHRAVTPSPRAAYAVD